MIDLNQLVLKARELEPLPATTTRLAALVADPDSDLKQVVSLVQLDPALSARLLRLANSASSGAARTIGTVREAILRVGVGSVLSLATAGQVRAKLRREVLQYGLTGDALWAHSIAAALAAEALRGVVRVSIPAEAFAAALLHDIGKLVMAAFLGPEELQMLSRAQHEGGLSHLRAEVEVLGVNHAELGGQVAAHWHLPDRIVRGITHHHTPDEGRDIICDVVCVANQLALESGVTPKHDEPHPDDTSSSWQRLGLTQEQFDIACGKVRDRFVEAQAVFG